MKQIGFMALILAYFALFAGCRDSSNATPDSAVALEAESQIEARVYEIRDLVRKPNEPTDEAVLTEQIKTIITESIGLKDEWQDGTSTIRDLNGNLIVKTTPENHTQVAAVLGDLRQLPLAAPGAFAP